MREFIASLEVTLMVVELSIWAAAIVVCVKLLVEIWKRFWGHRE